MFEKLRAEIRGILEDGEFVDEKETDILETTFALMRWLRLSPQPGKHLTKFDLILTTIVCFPFIITTCIADLIHQLCYRDVIIVDDALEAIAMIFSGTSIYIIMGIFIYKNRDIIRLARTIGCFKEFRKPASFDRANRFGNFVTKVFALYTIAGTLFYAVISFARRPKCLQENAKWHIERPCGLMTPAYLPTPFNDPPYMYLVLFLQVWNCCVICSMTSMLVTFICGLIVLINSRVRLLKEDLRAAFASPTADIRRGRLNACVSYHVYLINVVRELNACIRSVCFVQSSLLSIVIALIAYEFLMQPALKTMFHGLGWMIAMTILCRGGQALINESDDLATVIFYANWFDAEVETQKMVILMIAQAHYCFHLDTIFFGPLGIKTCGEVIQNAYSIIAFLM